MASELSPFTTTWRAFAGAGVAGVGVDAGVGVTGVGVTGAGVAGAGVADAGVPGPEAPGAGAVTDVPRSVVAGVAVGVTSGLLPY